MRLVAISAIIGGKGRIKPGERFSLDNQSEAQVLIDRGFAREDTDPVNVSDPGAGGAVAAALLAEEVKAGHVLDTPAQVPSELLQNARPNIPGAVGVDESQAAVAQTVAAAEAEARADTAGAADVSQTVSEAAKQADADAKASGVTGGNRNRR